MKHLNSSLPFATLVRQLAAATRRGLPLKEVGALLMQEASLLTGKQKIPKGVLEALSRGETLPQALEKSMPRFPQETVQWVRVAEQEGCLASVLEAWASDMEKQQRAHVALRLALVWPALVLASGCVLLIVISLFVMPVFADVYSGMGVELPLLTRVVFGAAKVAGEYWFLWGVAFAVLGLMYVTRAFPPKVIAGLQAVVGPLPFVRRLHAARFLSRLLDLVHAQQSSRSQLGAALAHLAASTGEVKWAGVARRLQVAAERDAPLSDAMADEPLLPRQISLYIRLGEWVGDVSAASAQLCENAEVDYRTALAYFERGAVFGLYLLLGLVVGVVVSAIYLPMFGLAAVA